MTETPLLVLLAHPVTFPPGTGIIALMALGWLWRLLVAAKAWAMQPMPVPVFAPRTAQTTPGSALRYLAQTERHLTRLGFDTVARLQTGPPGTPTPAYLLLSRNPQTGDEARGTARYSQQLNALRDYAPSLEFISLRGAGGQIVTVNSAPSDIFVQPDYLFPVHCPGIHDPALLYAIHQHRVAAEGGTAPAPATNRPPDPVGYLQGEYRRFFEAQISAGVLRLDPARGVYRKTGRGIVRAGWRKVRQRTVPGHTDEARLLQAIKPQGNPPPP